VVPLGKVISSLRKRITKQEKFIKKVKLADKYFGEGNHNSK
jgi:hypothetical protein